MQVREKRGNTTKLCKSVVDGAMDNGADVEYVNLYSYDFKGCMSCFACHLKKNFENPLCFWRDDLKEILKTCLKADAIGKFDDDEDLENFNHVQHILFNAPAVVYLALPKDHTKWSIYDLGGFGMSIMLAATDLGVDSIPAYELVKYPYILRDNLPIPEDEDIIMGIDLGYESEEHINEYDSPRLDLDEILKIN